jgi:hypothetical protein
MSEIKDIFVIYISLHYKHVLYGVWITFQDAPTVVVLQRCLE